MVTSSSYRRSYPDTSSYYQTSYRGDTSSLHRNSFPSNAAIRRSFEIETPKLSTLSPSPVRKNLQRSRDFSGRGTVSRDLNINRTRDKVRNMRKTVCMNQISRKDLGNIIVENDTSKVTAKIDEPGCSVGRQTDEIMSRSLMGFSNNASDTDLSSNMSSSLISYDSNFRDDDGVNDLMTMSLTSAGMRSGGLMCDDMVNMMSTSLCVKDGFSNNCLMSASLPPGLLRQKLGSDSRGSDSPYGKVSDSPYVKVSDSPYRKISDSSYRKVSDSSYGKGSDSPYRKVSDSPYGKSLVSPYGKSSVSSYGKGSVSNVVLPDTKVYTDNQSSSTDVEAIKSSSSNVNFLHCKSRFEVNSPGTDKSGLCTNSDTTSLIDISIENMDIGYQTKPKRIEQELKSSLSLDENNVRKQVVRRNIETYDEEKDVEPDGLSAKTESSRFVVSPKSSKQRIASSTLCSCIEHFRKDSDVRIDLIVNVNKFKCRYYSTKRFWPILLPDKCLFLDFFHEPEKCHCVCCYREPIFWSV